MLIIEDIEYYLPKNKISNEDLLKTNPDWDIKAIGESTGVLTRYYVDKNETALDIGFKACEKLFKKNHSLKEKVDAIIFCTHSNDYIIPSNSSLHPVSMQVLFFNDIFHSFAQLKTIV